MNTYSNFPKLALVCLLMLGSYAYAGAPGPKVVLYYESLAGDFSDIRLSISSDMTFALEMYLFEDDENIEMTGVWKPEGQQLLLTFTRNIPYVEALFAPYMIVNETTFQIDPYAEEMWIWDTLCSKSDPATYVACN